MEPLIPEVEEAVARAAAWAARPEATKRIGVLFGPATAGKTLALRRLSECLLTGGFRVFRLGPAGGQVDTCAQILAELGDHDAELADIAGNSAVPPSQRAREIHQLLGKLGNGRVALLFDEPRLDDSPSADPDPLMARALAGERAMARELTQADGFVRFVATVTPPEYEEIEKFPLTTRAPSNWLSKAEIWGPLEPHAKALANQLHGEELLRSALHLRLAVTLLALGDSVDGVKSTLRAGSEWVTTGLARRVWERSPDALRLVWAALAVARRGLSQSHLEELTRMLSEDHREIISRGLLYQVGADWRMHETVRAVALEQQDSAALQNEHVTAANRYLETSGAGLVSKVEAFHHWLSGGRPDQARRISPLDIDQLNLVGRFLSRQHLFEQAIEVFESVRKRRPEDDYALHYLAYNLDRLGRDPRQVESHYRAAIERAPDNLWWHSRYVCFLITQARDREARFAWTEALSATQSRATPSDAWHFENMHKWVIDLLLRRGQSDWAGNVLRTIPEQVFVRSADLRRLRDRQRAQVEVDRNGAAFPAWIEYSAWWTGPHLLPPQARRPGSKKEIPLDSWWAVRVEALSAGDVHLLYAERTADQKVSYGRTLAKKRTVEGWLGDVAGEELAPGRFLEIGFYGPNKKLVRARAHPRTSPLRLDDREEDTARYLRAPLHH